MKKTISIIFSLVCLLAPNASVMADGCKLTYKFTPGQQWLCNLNSKNESNYMGQKDVNQSRTVYAYAVSKGPKKGWVTLSARIQSKGPETEGQMDLSQLRFTADVHTSGEIRNIQYTGSVMPDLGPAAAQMPPAMKKMMEDSYKAIPEAYKHSVFWFPEVPEDKLEIGDEFDVQRKMAMAGGGGGAPGMTGMAGMGGMAMETVIHQVYILEDVSKGLAYFSVKDRSVTKVKGMQGGQSETKMAGKGDAIFDLEQGMWLEVTEKARAKVNLGGMAGMPAQDQDMNMIFKYEMERK